MRRETLIFIYTLTRRVSAKPKSRSRVTKDKFVVDSEDDEEEEEEEEESEGTINKQFIFLSDLSCLEEEEDASSDEDVKKKKTERKKRPVKKSKAKKGSDDEASGAEEKSDISGEKAAHANAKAG